MHKNVFCIVSCNIDKGNTLAFLIVAFTICTSLKSENPVWQMLPAREALLLHNHSHGSREGITLQIVTLHDKRKKNPLLIVTKAFATE